MSRLRVSIEIEATPQQVWDVVEPVEDHVEWMLDAVAIRFRTDQHRGVGTTFDCDTRVGPFRLVDRMEITEWEAGSVMGVRHVGLITGTGRFTLTSIDLERRTRFEWNEELTFPWWLGGRFGSLIIGRLVLRAIWTHNLRNLKAIVEAEL
ncbi:MAG TPA: SRPBCC family protein [Ilumatobacteraceae bacterium]|nr:SRPBCC family protein [Ilumatobacteraceae bacterium]